MGVVRTFSTFRDTSTMRAIYSVTTLHAKGLIGPTKALKGTASRRIASLRDPITSIGFLDSARTIKKQ